MLPTTDLRQNIQRITLNKAPAGVPGSFKLLQIAGGRCLALVAAVRNWNLCRIDDSNPKKCKSSSKSLRLDIIKTVKLHVYLPTLGVSPPPSLPHVLGVFLHPRAAVFNLVEACCTTLMCVILIIPMLNGT